MTSAGSVRRAAAANAFARCSPGERYNDWEDVKKLTQQLMGEKAAPASILDDGLIAGMNVVGERFKNHEIFLPDVLLAAKAMYAGMELLKPLLIAEGVPSMGKIVIGSVRGDLHDIGKNLVGAPEQLVEAAGTSDALVIGMSALLTTTMPVMYEVVERIEKEGLTGKVKTIVGGAPLNEQFAREIGADAYGYDAANAVDRVKQLMGKV
jgi:5-methyltetrahydrofolate--homocysteine methyltransferase